LEHLTLRLMGDEEIKREINAGYQYVFVDEYQDVNPVQEEIISSLSGETFLVGDVKQAIYGFRGSKSVFFSEKFKGFENSGGTALRLSSNFRSADGIINFVNALFSQIMQKDICGIDYKNTSQMNFGGLYPAGCGEAVIEIFGKDEEEERELKVYSVLNDGRKSGYTREGLAVLSIVEEECKKQHFDLKTGDFRDTLPGDICILTRKNRGDSTEGIVRALTDNGYAVAGAQETNVCALPEVKQMIDVLSLIDNAEQDIPLITALLSPLGGLCEDELAQIRIVVDAKKPASSLGGGEGGAPVRRDRKTFRRCCEEYSVLPTAIARKLNIFWGKLEELRDLSGVLNAGELIDELLEKYGLEGGYGADGERKIKNVLKLAEEGAALPLTAFLEKLKTGGYSVSAPAPAQSGSIKIMSMHASKGLEFPVVIIADICRTFKGADYAETPFDEVYGFAPKSFDTQKFLVHNTVLRRLVKLRSDGEEFKNELNLFYVACTRAMCRLHVLCEEAIPFDTLAAGDAKCYADLFDISKFPRREVLPYGGKPQHICGSAIISSPDETTVKVIENKFAVPYGHAESVDLPVKSSASAILKMGEDEPRHIPRRLFGGEGETSTERGIAYHRYLEVCDFKIRSAEGIEKELDCLLRAGQITDGQRGLLNAEELCGILSMPVFSGLEGCELYREQEFLCRIPANEILSVSATDPVLVQGAIDLLAVGNGGVRIIDYKYSNKSDEQLVQTYFKQLNLYKKAVAAIMKIEESTISAVIVNIHLKRQIDIV
ncbi:MAG: UvrD-helicase domain-containing protein, partial [Clostridia bacterium]|nr:UvrD-helicase domain-containing protein [Clostridia bacterium]